jgi:hypothetical protein
VLATICSGLLLSPTSLETATAYVVSEGEHVLSAGKRLAQAYEHEQTGHRMLKVVNPLPPRVEPLPQKVAVVEAGPHPAGATPPALTGTAMVSKVYSIIKTHAPKNRSARTLAEAIVSEAKREEYDPLFVAAVIKSESTFNTMARSHKGAQGLMQLMPKTGAWMADKSDIARGNLTDPGYNLKLGIKYLKELEKGYNGDRVFTLIAYNWGPGRVDSATDGRRRIPPEVVTYAVKIMNDYRRWRVE